MADNNIIKTRREMQALIDLSSQAGEKLKDPFKEQLKAATESLGKLKEYEAELSKIATILKQPGGGTAENYFQYKGAETVFNLERTATLRQGDILFKQAQSIKELDKTIAKDDVLRSARIASREVSSREVSSPEVNRYISTYRKYGGGLAGIAGTLVGRGSLSLPGLAAAEGVNLVGAAFNNVSKYANPRLALYARGMTQEGVTEDMRRGISYGYGTGESLTLLNQLASAGIGGTGTYQDVLQGSRKFGVGTGLLSQFVSQGREAGLTGGALTTDYKKFQDAIAAGFGEGARKEDIPKMLAVMADALGRLSSSGYTSSGVANTFNSLYNPNNPFSSGTNITQAMMGLSGGGIPNTPVAQMFMANFAGKVMGGSKNVSYPLFQALTQDPETLKILLSGNREMISKLPGEIGTFGLNLIDIAKKQGITPQIALGENMMSWGQSIGVSPAMAYENIWKQLGQSPASWSLVQEAQGRQDLSGFMKNTQTYRDALKAKGYSQSEIDRTMAILLQEAGPSLKHYDDSNPNISMPLGHQGHGWARDNGYNYNTLLTDDMASVDAIAGYLHKKSGGDPNKLDEATYNYGMKTGHYVADVYAQQEKLGKTRKSGTLYNYNVANSPEMMTQRVGAVWENIGANLSRDFLGGGKWTQKLIKNFTKAKPSWVNEIAYDVSLPFAVYGDMARDTINAFRNPDKYELISMNKNRKYKDNGGADNQVTPIVNSTKESGDKIEKAVTNGNDKIALLLAQINTTLSKEGLTINKMLTTLSPQH